MKILRTHHVAVICSDYERSRRFYTEILGLEVGRLAPGAPADLILVDPDVPWVLDADTLRSKSKNTPFEGARFSGRVLRTMVAGRTVFEA